MRISNGRSGTFTLSYGEECKEGFDIEVATTNGVVTVGPTKVHVTTKGIDGRLQRNSVPFAFDSAVAEEVDAFAESIRTNTTDPRMSPLQALDDLTVLQAILRSGSQNGGLVDLHYSFDG